MRRRREILIGILVCLSLFAFTSMSWGTVSKVICVPWQGDITKPHTAISGQAVQLKGVVKTTDTATYYYKWVFGDGTSDSAVTPISGSTKYNIAITHTYTAATGTPFTAYLQVADNNAIVSPMIDTYLLKIENNTIDAQINIAIDNGLWWLYNSAYSNNPVYGSNYGNWTQTYDGSTAMTWLQTSYEASLAAPTASAIHAFAINNHKINGNPDEDPYVEAVKFGMNYLVNGYLYYTSWPALRAVSFGKIDRGGGVFDYPDGNSNGYGIEVYDYSDVRPIYQGGQVMDAIIASGVLPTDSTGRDFAGSGHIWTYRELLQDMADMYAWGQCDGASCIDSLGNGGKICGSWWYGWNYGAYGDDSASQWGAIGMIPAQQSPWNIIVPSWVKTYNGYFLETMKCYYDATHNYFGYNGPCSCAGDSCLQTTPSGMVQMVMDGQTTADPKWGKSQLYQADNWYAFLHNGSTWGSRMSYGWYAFTKAMRLALPDPVTQITKTGDTPFDWYYGDPSVPCTSQSDCKKGLAQRIVEIQHADGSWDGNLADPPLTTAWMIIMLKPTLFQASASACFTAQPNPSYPDQNIFFNPSCSTPPPEPGAALVKYEWDWNNDGTYEQSTTTPDIVKHQFSCAVLPCTYPVVLRVTDNSTPPRTATTTQNIVISNPPHPPVAKAGGPYTVSLCSNDTLKLDGSASYDPDQGQHQAGCNTCPDDTITAWDWDLTEANGLTFVPVDKHATVATVTLNAADIASFFTGGTHNIGLRVTDNTALAYPGSGEPNLTNADFTTVNVQAGCICNLVARPKLTKVELTWTHTGAPSYDIYRSTTGPNTGFVRIAQNYVTTYATYLDTTVVVGTTYYYRVVANPTGCGSNWTSAKPTNR